MKSQDLFAYQATMADATKDIHSACGNVELSILWDDGKIGMVTGTHKVRIWNALGSAEFQITHDELLAQGNAYKGVLAMIAATASKKMRV